MDMFIDDGPDKLLGLANTIPTLFLFDQPYNLDEEVPTKIARAKDWGDLLSKIESL